MTAITFKTNGQRLVIHSSSATLYTEAAASNAVTLPKVIDADVTYYTAPAAYKTALVVKDRAGRTIYSQTVGSAAWQAAATVEPLPTVPQIADVLLESYLEQQACKDGEETFPRLLHNATATMTSGVLRCAYFTCRKAQTVTRLSCATAGTAAGATPTLVRIGLWTADEDGALLELVASTANDTALLAATHTEYIKATSASYDTVLGQRYAFGLLVVTGATAPIVSCNSGGNPASVLAPRTASQVNSQADLPASVAAGSLTLSPALPWGRLLPAA